MLAILPRVLGSYSYAGVGYANPHAVTSVGGTTYTYDNNGNVTSIGSLDYTWDWRNRLASAERGGGDRTTYGYDHTGQRVFKAMGTATTSYPNKYYNLATTTGAATTTKHIFTPDGTLLAAVEGSGVGTATTTYLHPDHLGGTNVTTDEDGAISQTLDYYPYGSQRIAAGSVSEPRRFVGEELDLDTEFSYLNARYYQGSRGQFMSQDPVFLRIGSGGQDVRNKQQLAALLADPQLLNSYSYARGNPISLKDPTGQIPVVLAVWTGANFAYNAAQYFIERYEANTARMHPSAFSPNEYAALQGAPGNRLEDFAGGVVASLISSPIGVALDFAGLIGDINDEFQYYFPDAVKRREERFTKDFKQSVSITAGTNGSSGYIAPHGGGSSPVRSVGSSANPVSSRSSSTFGLTANTEIASTNVDAFISFIAQFLK